MNDQEEKPIELLEVRCERCNKLLFKADMEGTSYIEIICSRCKEMNEVEIDCLQV